jgi:hypothetical protein
VRSHNKKRGLIWSDLVGFTWIFANLLGFLRLFPSLVLLRVHRVTPPNWVQRHAGFSDKNWVKMGSFSFFEKVEMGEIVNV